MLVERCCVRMKSCKKCKYSDLDYIFDNEIGEEYPIYTCKKGHNKLLNFDYVADRQEVLIQQEECADFEEYKPKPYKEEDTRCEKCEYLSKCMKECDYIDCTTSQDTRKHIIVGNSYCFKSRSE